MRIRRRRPAGQVEAALHAVALAQPAHFDAQRLVGGFHQTLDLDPLDATPAEIVLANMGVRTAAELLEVMRGVAALAAVNALAYALRLYDTTVDDVVSTVVIVADDTTPFPSTLTP